MLYERDYRKLTTSEKNKMDKLDKWFSGIEVKKGGISADIFIKYWDEMPQAAQYYKTMFPNNCFTEETDNLNSTKKIISAFKKLLQRKPQEREILEFIKTNNAYFLIVTPLRFEFSTGNHERYIFREFALPPNHIADYLVIGKNSGGYDFIFVELESVYDKITTKTGEFGSSIRKGIKQIEEWDAWIDGNFSHLKTIFAKSKGNLENLPGEFYSLDKSRIHYAVIAGRRSDYTELTYRLRRKLRKSSGIALMHYDNLLDIVTSIYKDELKREKERVNEIGRKTNNRRIK